MFGAMDLMFSVIPVIVALGFLLVFGLLVYNIIFSIRKKRADDASPVLTVQARVAAKRMDLRRYSQPIPGELSGMHGSFDRSATRYYTAFEVASGDRMEFALSGHEYGLLAEGDTGELTFQGSRFLGFARDKK